MLFWYKTVATQLGSARVTAAVNALPLEALDAVGEEQQKKWRDALAGILGTGSMSHGETKVQCIGPLTSLRARFVPSPIDALYTYAVRRFRSQKTAVAPRQRHPKSGTV